ncbi:MAG: DUF1385 domain-containing protein [Myxococcota bacterium]
MSKRSRNVGGQAVLEGVMMRAPGAMAVAVRRGDGRLVVLDEPWRPFWTHPFIRRLMEAPVMRGGLVLVESVVNGLGALGFAAEQAEGDAYRGPRAAALLPVLAVLGVQSPRGARAPAIGTLLLSVTFALGLFVGLPHLLAWLVSWLTGGGWDVDSFAFHLLDGVFKLGIFVGYISLISRIPEIARVFEYHGAEHKVVNAFERGRPLQLDEVRLQGTFHARCGTSFVLVVLLVSVAVFSAILPLVPPISEHPILNHLAMILLKLPLMLPLAGLAYELNRWASQHPGAAGVNLLVSPGRWMQRLTVREPDDAQLEVSLAAIRVALHREGRGSEGQEAPADVRVFEGLPDVEAAYPLS